MQKHQKAISLAAYVHTMLHGDAPEIIGESTGRAYPIKNWADGNVRGVDLGEYRFLTQNPTKDSKFGKMAQAGRKVSWVIHQPTRTFIARVIDGQTKAL